mmetsp:Transcript_102473/g.298904  ORF Transcript_102473/g.298904 Transcript_102473/m.298904 type:complete len:242 (+) Transcript_102473:111-836(+)
MNPCNAPGLSVVEPHWLSHSWIANPCCSLQVKNSFVKGMRRARNSRPRQLREVGGPGQAGRRELQTELLRGVVVELVEPAALQIVAALLAPGELRLDRNEPADVAPEQADDDGHGEHVRLVALAGLVASCKAHAPKPVLPKEHVCDTKVREYHDAANHLQEIVEEPNVCHHLRKGAPVGVRKLPRVGTELRCRGDEQQEDDGRAYHAEHDDHAERQKDVQEVIVDVLAAILLHEHLRLDER